MPTTKNDKQNPINGATNWQAVTDELHTIELQTDKGIYGFYLKQYPQSVGTTTLSNITTGAPTGDTLTIGLSGVPTPGVVRVDFTNKTGWVWCHQDDNGKTISCDYNGGGFVGHEENLDEIVEELATPIAEAAGAAAAEEFVGDRPTNIRTRDRVPSNAADTDHDITFSAGHFYGSDGIGYEVAAITKQIDAAWAEGTNAGGLDTGAVASNTWYYAHEIRQDSSGDMDVIFSTSSTAGGVTMPVGWTHKRVMSEWVFRTDGSANFRNMQYAGDGWMYWKTPPQLDLDSAAVTTARTTFSILAPTGYVWKVSASVLAADAASNYVFSNPEQTDTAPSDTAAPLIDGGPNTNKNERHRIELITNASSQLSVRASAAMDTLRVCVKAIKNTSAR